MKDSGAEKIWKLPALNLKRNKDSAQSHMAPAPRRDATALQKIWEVVKILCVVVYRLRAVFLSIPVIYVALRLAAYNSEYLPLMVGLDLQTTGEFAKTISRQTAVTFPLFLTGGCLVLTFLSKKSLYPWLISIFSLAIPIMLLITNMYPA